MNIGDRLRAEVRELESRESHDLDDDYRRFLEAYDQWLQDPRYQAQAVSRAEGPQLGIAAYTLGIHLTAMGRPAQARRWLQIAARYDVGDAALRLAHLHELERLSNLDTAAISDDEPIGAESRALARIWYGQARNSGYTTGEERPPADLDLEECCPVVGKLRAREEAQRIVAEAKDEADALIGQAKADAAVLIRQARVDVQSIVDDARAEVQKLAMQRRILVERLMRVQATLSVYSSPVSREMALCARILLAILQHDEPVSRQMIATISKELTEHPSWYPQTC